MNQNVIEIGHISFKLKDEKTFRDFYENTLKLNTGFILKNKLDEDRIVYYQLNRRQFLEVFPETSLSGWPTYKGKSNDENLSYQYATIGSGDSEKIIKDPEGNQFIINKGEKYISQLTYYVNDLNKSKEYYTKVLLLDLNDETEDHVVVKINDFQSLLLIQQPYSESNNTDNKGYCHFALIVHDIVKEARRLEAMGVQLYHGPQTMNYPYTEPYEAVKHSENTYNFYMHDVDDNEIEVMQYSEESFQLVYSSK